MSNKWSFNNIFNKGHKKALSKRLAAATRQTRGNSTQGEGDRLTMTPSTTQGQSDNDAEHDKGCRP